jgi:acyl-CoA thioester hydrolase
MLHESLKDFPVVITVPMHWGEQDAFGHANNINYFRWAETARIEYLIRVGAWERYEREKVGPIVASLSCNFRRPLNYPDTLHVGARITNLGNSSLNMVHSIVSASEGVLAADLTSTLVLLDYNVNRPVRIPDDMRRQIARLEGWEVAASR